MTSIDRMSWIHATPTARQVGLMLNILVFYQYSFPVRCEFGLLPPNSSLVGFPRHSGFLLPQNSITFGDKKFLYRVYWGAVICTLHGIMSWDHILDEATRPWWFTSSYITALWYIYGFTYNKLLKPCVVFSFKLCRVCANAISRVSFLDFFGPIAVATTLII